MSATLPRRERRWPLVAALALTYVTFAILLNSVGAVILQSVATFGIDNGRAAALEAFKDLPIAVISCIAAAALPRIGYRRGMMLALALVIAGTAAMPLLPSFATVKLLFVLTGIGFALVKTSTYATIGLITPDARSHASLTNAIEGIFMVGVLAGYWLFAAFIDPRNPASPGWLNVYWVLAGLAAVNLMLILSNPFDESDAIDPNSTGIRGDMRAMAGLLGRPLIQVFALSAFLYVLIEQGVGSWLPTFNAEVLHLPPAMSVQAASLFAGALAVGRLGAGGLIRLVGWFPVLAGCLCGVALVILLVVPLAGAAPPQAQMSWATAPVSILVMPMIGLCLAPIYPTLNSAILSSLPRARHAAMTGLIIVFSALGGATGSFLTGKVFALLGGVSAFRLVLIPTVSVLLLLPVLRILLGRDQMPVQSE
ncbi:MFS transporter [Sphingomonas sp.]|uniref:MFS transporter n=1 Tax=Sphingomonas sp. TaxID=28214 RepID=UPI001EC2125B|nr:MFS transporter [Sphingomonas sp.]MBX3595058.1 MFS transporter [Sphingomonas sp.]